MVKYYYKDGTASSIFISSKLFHREDGPAVEYDDGYKAWYINGLCHRLDGPAIIHGNGSVAYYIEGCHIAENAFNRHPFVIAYKADKAIREVLNV